MKKEGKLFSIFLAAVMVLSVAVNVSAESTATSESTAAIECAQGATVLKLNSPTAIAKGRKTFVDPTNLEVMPIIENDRTLVPVRFIAESFDAQVDWDPENHEVRVQHGEDEIAMWIGQAKMEINGVEKALDVPANIYKDRTVLPIRALAEALGKTVYWSERGLIIVTDTKTEYSAAALEKMERELSVRLRVGGEDVHFFSVDCEVYELILDAQTDVPQISVWIYGEPVEVKQASTIGECASFTAYDKSYSIRFTDGSTVPEDPYESWNGNDIEDGGILRNDN